MPSLPSTPSPNVFWKKIRSPGRASSGSIGVHTPYKLVAPSLPTSRTPDSLNIHEMKPEQSNDVSGLSPPQT